MKGQLFPLPLRTQSSDLPNFSAAYLLTSQTPNKLHPRKFDENRRTSFLNKRRLIHMKNTFLFAFVLVSG